MSDIKRILIVGGVAGGASAAARARRLSEDAEIVVFERGAEISFANCGMPYHIAGVIPERQRLLVQTPASFRKRFRVDVRPRTQVVRIDPSRRQVIARDLGTGQEQAERYDKLILSPGAEPIRPPITGIDSKLVFTLRSLSDMDAIKAVLDTRRPQAAVIIGGGYIGLEMAEALRARGLEVTLVELTNQVFGPIDPEMAEPVHQQLKLHGVRLLLGTSVTSIEQGADAAGPLTVHLSTGQSVACGLAILATGVRPEVQLARDAGLKIGPSGGIAVNDHMRTSDEDIYAVGDAVEVSDFVTGAALLVPLAGPANRQGRIAADNALGRDSVYRRTQGTAICKVFDIAVGLTGLTEKAARRANLPCETVYVHPAAHASYYPLASPISLKLVFDPVSGKVLGAQAVGSEGVDKRMDVLAVAIRAGMTVMDLQDLELSYAPPYGSAKDVINYAGFVASNVVKGDVKLCHVQDVVAPRPDQLLVDVRTPTEVQAGTIPGAVNIPVDELRGRLGELPRDKELLVFCQVGLRGYIACRILSQRGFNCRNLTGGYKTYRSGIDTSFTPATPPPEGPKELRDDTGSGGAQDDPSPPPGACGCGEGPACGTACAQAAVPVKAVDARGLQCPGPILRLKKELSELRDGQALSITATDPAFAGDVRAWCHSTGNELEEVVPENSHYRATVIRRTGKAPDATRAPGGPAAAKNKTLVVFSNDLDRVLAAFIIANGAASMGSDVTMFFTFWGLNVLRRSQAVRIKKTLIERVFGRMMPRGPDKLKLSKMHMGGMGTAMMKGIMSKKNVDSLPSLIEAAKASGVRLVACSMSMDVMGIHREELIDGVELGGVAMYLDHAESGNVNLFI